MLSSCPEKDTSCRIEDGSNVLNVLSTISDGECGCESKVSHVWGVPKKWDVCSNGYNFSKIHQKLTKLGCLVFKKIQHECCRLGTNTKAFNIGRKISEEKKLKLDSHLRKCVNVLFIA